MGVWLLLPLLQRCMQVLLCLLLNATAVYLLLLTVLLQGGLLRHAFMLLLLLMSMALVVLLLLVQVTSCTCCCHACCIRLVSGNPILPIVGDSMGHYPSLTQVAGLSCTADKTIDCCCCRKQSVLW